MSVMKCPLSPLVNLIIASAEKYRKESSDSIKESMN